jgi:hypothetical protein
MADIKFKICGNDPPFLAQVWRNLNGCLTLVCQKGVDYSGTCVTIGSLLPSTSYCIKITDRIGNTTNTGCTISTPAQCISDVPTTKTLSLIGTGYMPSVKSCSFKNTSLSMTPALLPGESYDVRLCLVTCNIVGTNNNISFVSTTCGSSTTFGTYINNNNSTNPVTCITRTVNYGDNISWNLTTSMQTGALEGSGYGVIKIGGVTANTGTFCTCLHTADINTYCKRSQLTYEEPVATTTTAPTTSGAIVYFKSLTNEKDESDPLGDAITWVRSSCLTHVDLTAGQQFDVDVQFYACTNDTNTIRGVGSYSYYMVGATKYTMANSWVASGPNTAVMNETKTFTNLTRDSLSNYSFWSCSVVAKGSDFANDFNTCGCVNIIRIKNVSSGSVTIDPESSITNFKTAYTDSGPVAPEGGNPV